MSEICAHKPIFCMCDMDRAVACIPALRESVREKEAMLAQAEAQVKAVMDVLEEARAYIYNGIDMGYIKDSEGRMPKDSWVIKKIEALSSTPILALEREKRLFAIQELEKLKMPLFIPETERDIGIDLERLHTRDRIDALIHSLRDKEWG